MSKLLLLVPMAMGAVSLKWHFANSRKMGFWLGASSWVVSFGLALSCWPWHNVYLLTLAIAAVVLGILSAAAHYKQHPSDYWLGCLATVLLGLIFLTA